MRRTLAASLLLLVGIGTGCITIAGGNLPPIEPSAPSVQGTIEETVGDFSFTLEGGKMITSNKAGRMLNDEILSRWKKHGYIASHTYVKSSEFTGTADYNLTLSGSMYGESSIIMQILSGLTLFLIPHSIHARFDIQYTLENVKTKERFSAEVEDDFKQWSELFLIFAAPFAKRGESKTYDDMAAHLFDQLDSQGAFGP